MHQKFHYALRDKHPGKKMTILQHDNTWLHSDHLCKERIQKNRWQLLHHQQPYTPDQAPPRLPSFWIRKGSCARPALCDDWSSPESHPHHLWTAEMVFYYKGVFKNSGKNASFRMEDFAEKW